MTRKTMSRNTILDELHAARRKLLADYNGDTAAYLQDAQARLEASGRPIWQGKQRAIRYTGAAKSGGLTMDDQLSPPGDFERSESLRTHFGFIVRSSKVR